MELQKLIKLLLADNRFVSLPTIGSFMVTYKSAALSADGKSFHPPQEVIRFDTSRKFNDEAIERALVERYEMAKNAAQDAVSAFVLWVNQRLTAGHEVYFDGVGTLTLSDGGIVFVAEDDDKRVASTFGLADVAIEPVKGDVKKQVAPKTVQTAQASPQKGSSQRRVRSNKAFYTGIVIGVLVLLLAVSTLLFIPEFRFWQTEGSHQNIVQVADDNVDSDFMPVDSAANEPIDTMTFTPDTYAELPVQESEMSSISVDTDKKAALYYEEPVPQVCKTFYIISGSFERMENAQIHLKRLEHRGYRPEILKSNGSYRVSMLKYTDRNRALRELERLRKEKPNQSVWLLGL
ncbi:MAG: SPOR domain-containing protein [Bacteroidales bacterium]|nr:SPOR domain-containing protein [Bacteroidales bacterium]